MYVKRILLQNYRNYESLNLDLTRNVNILCGQNAQGKTNILEAVYLSGTTGHTELRMIGNAFEPARKKR